MFFHVFFFLQPACYSLNYIRPAFHIPWRRVAHWPVRHSGAVVYGEVGILLLVVILYNYNE